MDHPSSNACAMSNRSNGSRWMSGRSEVRWINLGHRIETTFRAKNGCRGDGAHLRALAHLRLTSQNPGHRPLMVKHHDLFAFLHQGDPLGERTSSLTHINPDHGGTLTGPGCGGQPKIGETAPARRRTHWVPPEGHQSLPFVLCVLA